MYYMEVIKMKDLGGITAEVLKLEEEKELFMEMSSVKKKIYNLPVNIWLDDIGVERNTKHNFPRIKVQTTYADNLDIDNCLSLSIEDSPRILAGVPGKLKTKDLNEIKRFVSRNKDILLDYWYNKITLKDVLNKMQ